MINKKLSNTFKKAASLALVGALTTAALVGCGTADAKGSGTTESASENTAGATTATSNDTTNTDDTASSNDTASENGEKEEVTLRLADMSVYGIAIFNYAEEIGLLDGYFDDLTQYDVKVELSEWASGVDQNSAYAAGEIDFSSMGNIPAVTGVANGYGTKILAVNYLYDDEYVLVAREGSGIESVEDLKDKNVGTYVGTVSHYAVAKYLEYGGLNINDVNLLNVGAETVTSLRNGDIDAGILGNVVAHQLEEDGTGYIVAADKVPIYNYVVGNEEFASKYPEITVKVLELINDTWAHALENQDDYIEFYANASGLEVETVAASWKDNFPIKSAKDFSEEDYEAYTNFVDWMKSVEYVDSSLDADSLLDLSYVKQINNAE